MCNTVKIEQYIKPIETVEAFVEALKKVHQQNLLMAGSSDSINATAAHKRDCKTIEALKERGFPSKDEYGLEKITAHDALDLEIKFNLAILPYSIAMIEHEDLSEEILDTILPMTEACHHYLEFYRGPFPVTITPE